MEKSGRFFLYTKIENIIRRIRWKVSPKSRARVAARMITVSPLEAVKMCEISPKYSS